MADVEHVEGAVDQDDGLTLCSPSGGLIDQRFDGPKLVLRRGHASPPVTAARSSSAVTVAVPSFITTSPAAMLASRAPSSGEAPAARAAVSTARTVSPAPVTSATSSAPKTGRWATFAAFVGQGHTAVAAGGEQEAGAELGAQLLGGGGDLDVAAEATADGDLELLEVGCAAVDTDEFADPVARVETDPAVGSDGVAQRIHHIGLDKTIAIIRDRHRGAVTDDGGKSFQKLVVPTPTIGQLVLDIIASDLVLER